MKLVRIAVLLIPLIVNGCIGGDATSISGNARGGAGVDVEVYRSDNSVYFEAGPGGSRQLRQQYRSMVASVCVTPYGNCPMGVAIPIRSSCYCPTYMGPVWGQAH